MEDEDEMMNKDEKYEKEEELEMMKEKLVERVPLGFCSQDFDFFG